MLETIADLFEKLRSLGAAGHILTFAGSVLTTTLFFLRYTANARAELRRLRLEIRNQYADQLLKQRLECYPECYRLLSDFIKVGRGFSSGRRGYAAIPIEQIITVNDSINSWDSEHAILMSNDAGRKIYELRIELQRAITALAENSGAAMDAKAFEVIADKMAIVEIALKTDIGVFAVDEFLNLARPTYYSEIEPAGVRR